MPMHGRCEFSRGHEIDDFDGYYEPERGMSTKKLVVLTLDSFSPAAVGCYGSSWNETPAMDQIAAQGCVWDRAIVGNTDPQRSLAGWFSRSDWFHAWKQKGSVEWLSDSQPAIALATKSDFDQLYFVDPIDEGGPVDPAAEIESTQFAQLIAAAVERISEGDDWSVLWLHSDFLSQRWDAPRWLVESGPMDEISDEPMDDAEALAAEMRRAQSEPADSLSELPSAFDTTVPPQIQIDDDSHPDLVATWMQTYGCQIRLVDELIRVLLTSANDAVGDGSLSIVLAGTSGISLGQNGWIGSQVGPLRSCHIHVPMMIGQHTNRLGPMRVPSVCDAGELADRLTTLTDDQPTMVMPQRWSPTDRDAFHPSVTSQMGADQWSITSPGWFFVRQADDQRRLYLKPDDVNDFSDVSRLRLDVVDHFKGIEATQFTKKP